MYCVPPRGLVSMHFRLAQDSMIRLSTRKLRGAGHTRLVASALSRSKRACDKVWWDYTAHPPITAPRHLAYPNPSRWGIVHRTRLQVTHTRPEWAYPHTPRTKRRAGDVQTGGRRSGRQRKKSFSRRLQQPSRDSEKRDEMMGCAWCVWGG